MSPAPIPAAEAIPRARSGEAFLLDIRERYEAELAAVLDAVRIPFGLLLAEPERMPHDRPVLVLDHEGTHSRFAARYLRSLGIDAHPVDGGALAYLAARP